VDLQITSETYETADWAWLGSKHGIDTAKTVTVLLSACVEATHFPNGRINPGTILSKFTSGSNAGLWAPHVHDDTVGEGLGTPAAIVLDGFRVRTNDGSNIGTVVAGSAVLAGTPLQIVVANLPGLLEEDGTTAYAPVAADLPSAMTALSLA